MKKYYLFVGILVILACSFHLTLHANSLVEAVQKEDVERVKELVEAGHDIEVKGPFGQTLLYLSNPEITEYLLAQGLDFNVKDVNASTALHANAFYANSEVCKILISSGAKIDEVDKFNYTPLHAAAGACDPNDFGTNMMAVAITLEEAQAKQTEKVVAMLISKGADVDAKDIEGYTPLHWASTRGRKGVAEILISKGCNVNAKANLKQTPLDNASFNGHFELVKLLISNGANINAKDDSGTTALHNAAAGGHVDIAEYLILNGADLNARSKGGFFSKGKTPLGLAYKAEQIDMINFLKMKGGKE